MPVEHLSPFDTPPQEGAEIVYGPVDWQEQEAALGVLATTSELQLDIPNASEEIRQPEASYADTMARVGEAARTRAQEALESSDFVATPEVRKAVEGYYSDHLKLAATVEYVVQNPNAAPSEEEIEQTSFDTYATSEGAKRLLALSADPSQREATLKLAQELTDKVIFKEASLGATTLTEHEAAIIPDLCAQIKQAALTEGVAVIGGSGEAMWWTVRPGHNDMLPTDHHIAEMQQRRMHMSDEFWDDTRHAGQLLFHNTGNLLDVVRSGHKLMSRTGQVKEYGTFNAQTAVYDSGKSHTNVPHFSEDYDWHNYKLDGTTGERNPGTLAVPLAEVVKQAPYARNSEYGVVRLKDAKNDTAVPINDRLTNIGPGGFDVSGQNGTDRVFFADYRADHTDEAHDYALDLGMGMSSDYGNTSHILITEREYRDAYEGVGFGAGKGIPALEVLPFDDGGPKLQGLEAGARIKAETPKLAAAIHDLQLRSREMPQFKDKLVVPLRVGVMEFKTEGQRPGEALASFQQDVEHSMINGRDERKKPPRWAAA